MEDAATRIFEFDNSFVRDLAGLYEPWRAAEASAPDLVAFNDELARELGAKPDDLRSESGVAALVGNIAPAGVEPVAQAYAGHQFGNLSPRLGDGRALLLGEVVDTEGRRRDLHLKGSGRTPFARGGDGLAALGPMLREYLMCEAMDALGIPTTRALAVVATGDRVARDTMLPGAVLVRVASSHLRVGTFQYAAMAEDPSLVRRLADHAIARHDPAAADVDDASLAFFENVMDRQAALVAQWMSVGFVHGVMNTDNTTISGETIDYGPCAFMEAYDPATVFSSIDHGGRYAYGNQPAIVQWNLARLAESLLPLFHSDIDTAVEIATSTLQTFPDRYREHWFDAMLPKIGVVEASAGDAALVDDLVVQLETERVEFTSCFRSLSAAVRDETIELEHLGPWVAAWRERLDRDHRSASEIADSMDRVNPIYIPRNHLVEEVLDAATDGDNEPFDELMSVLDDPFTERAGLDRFVQPAPPDFGPNRTFCDT